MRETGRGRDGDADDECVDEEGDAVADWGRRRGARSVGCPPLDVAAVLYRCLMHGRVPVLLASLFPRGESEPAIV